MGAAALRAAAADTPPKAAVGWYPHQDSNLNHRLRRPVLYPLSYGGTEARDRRERRFAAPKKLQQRGRAD